jgi:hypothetical protein
MDADRLWREVPAAAGGAVMATAVVSDGLYLAGRVAVSDPFLVIAGVLWVALAAVFLRRLVHDRARWLREAGLPASLTAVAGITVLGTRLAWRAGPGRRGR